ncbi:hypothetical protein B0H13DRAFT_1862834 [Mycena leptocephala]|nr:hypothetical protein B0H13DRAFT_1862834 [Mycena leptocephala]
MTEASKDTLPTRQICLDFPELPVFVKQEGNFPKLETREMFCNISHQHSSPTFDKHQTEMAVYGTSAHWPYANFSGTDASGWNGVGGGSQDDRQFDTHNAAPSLGSPAQCHTSYAGSIMFPDAFAQSIPYQLHHGGYHLEFGTDPGSSSDNLSRTQYGEPLNYPPELAALEQQQLDFLTDPSMHPKQSAPDPWVDFVDTRPAHTATLDASAMDPAQGNDMWITHYTPQYPLPSMSTPLGHNRTPRQLLFSPPVTPQADQYTGFGFVEIETPESGVTPYISQTQKRRRQNSTVNEENLSPSTPSNQPPKRARVDSARRTCRTGEEKMKK